MAKIGDKEKALFKETFECELDNFTAQEIMSIEAWAELLKGAINDATERLQRQSGGQA
jgi:hypothetical protein